MPPLPLLPNQPAGIPDWHPTSGHGPSSAAASSSSGRPRFATSQYGPVMLPGDWSDEEARQYIAAYDEYIAKLERMWSASEGLQRRQFEAQIKDAQQARANEIRIAQLNAETSRYGTDARRQTEVEQLQENRRQFDLSHGVEMERLGIDRQRLGLDRAKVATDYLSTPDRFIQAGDFLNLSGRVLAGQQGPAPYGTTGDPQMKTMGDFAVLEAGGNPGRQVNPAQAAAVGGSGADARIKAINGILQAVPPSSGDGLDSNDFAVLSAARAIMSTNLTPQQQASISSSKQYQQMLGSAGRRLGHNPDEWWSQQQRSRPGQGSTRLA